MWLHFGQNYGWTRRFYTNLYLLQTKLLLCLPVLSEPLPTSDKMPAGFPVLSELVPTSDKMPAGASPFCPNLYLLQTKLLLCLSFLSEPRPTSDKMTAGHPYFVRISVPTSDKTADFASPFCPNLCLLQTKCRLGLPVFVRTSAYFRQNAGWASPFCPNLYLLQTKLLLCLSRFVRTSTYFRQNDGDRGIAVFVRT